MSTSAIVMMVVSLVIVWGGLIAAILKLRAHPDEPEEPPVVRDAPNGG
ncbi:methionine/alanine import family NSS transporter small subunit [Streptomyces apocyni]|nr:methionine/alanine import family NSS transporter small subunit [Streptomyces apocyni]